jgi:hypothetical protein
MLVVNSTTLAKDANHPNMGITGSGEILSLERYNYTDRSNMVAIGHAAGANSSG